MPLNTDNVEFRSPAVDTPTVDTATLTAIRKQIEPNRGFWQVQLRPWHYWTAISSTLIVGAAFVALLASIGHLR